MQIIGIDCSTNLRNVGLARATVSAVGVAVAEVMCADQGWQNLLVTWIDSAKRTLLCLDAPLGWPVAFAELASHRAGERVNCPRRILFNRETDRLVQKELGQTPLRVGADLIAMTAHWALELLNSLRSATGERIPLTWTRNFSERVTAIEVYPAATLRSRRLDCSRYKDATDACRSVRERIVHGIQPLIDVTTVGDSLLRDSDMLDAAICCLAGADFLSADVFSPEDGESARKEGWIWVRRPSAEPARFIDIRSC